MFLFVFWLGGYRMHDICESTIWNGIFVEQHPRPYLSYVKQKSKQKAQKSGDQVKSEPEGWAPNTYPRSRIVEYGLNQPFDQKKIFCFLF